MAKRSCATRKPVSVKSHKRARPGGNRKTVPFSHYCRKKPR